MRKSKNPEERKNEIVKTAERLFWGKGYENTSVSDIVKESKIAQGTFYYHFNSKLDILEEIAEYVHSDSNIVLHSKIHSIFNKILSGILDSIVQNGVKQGGFHTSRPLEAKVFLRQIIHAAFHSRELMEIPDRINQTRQAVLESFALILKTGPQYFFLQDV